MAATTEDLSTPEFHKLGPQISLSTPVNPVSGELVILCTWLGAGKRPIARYTTLHRRIAPNARILLIESAVPILVSSYPSQREAIKPAAEVVRAVLQETSDGSNPLPNSSGPVGVVNPSRILLHTFSNGGTNSATQLLIVLHDQLHQPLPLLGLICDSGPAMGTYWKSYNAMVLSLPKESFSRTIGPAAVHVILCLLYFFVACGRYPKPEDLIRETLLDGDMVTNSYRGTSRVCYIFSKADKMVEWTDIVAHGKTARRKGWEVEELLLEDSPHCNHISKYERQYTETVQAMWEGTPVQSPEAQS